MNLFHLMSILVAALGFTGLLWLMTSHAQLVRQIMKRTYVLRLTARLDSYAASHAKALEAEGAQAAYEYRFSQAMKHFQMEEPNRLRKLQWGHWAMAGLYVVVMVWVHLSNESFATAQVLLSLAFAVLLLIPSALFYFLARDERRKVGGQCRGPLKGIVNTAFGPVDLETGQLTFLSAI